MASNSVDSGAPLSEQVNIALFPDALVLQTDGIVASVITMPVQLTHFSLHDLCGFLQTISQALATAREHLARSLLK